MKPLVDDCTLDPFLDAGWTRETRCGVSYWLRIGLTAAELQSATRDVLFADRAVAIEILICKPKGLKMPTLRKCNLCSASIFWTRTPAGKSLPLNAEPTPAGNITIDDDLPGQTTARVHGAEALAGLNESLPRYLSHFATCPRAAKAREQR